MKKFMRSTEAISWDEYYERYQDKLGENQNPDALKKVRKILKSSNKTGGNDERGI